MSNNHNYQYFILTFNSYYSYAVFTISKSLIQPPMHTQGMCTVSSKVSFFHKLPLATFFFLPSSHSPKSTAPKVIVMRSELPVNSHRPCLLLLRVGKGQRQAEN